MRKFLNQCHIEGYLYEHNLTQKITGQGSKNPGTEYISGTISIATDNAVTNIVDVHFTYVTVTTATGKANATYTTLKNIVDGNYKTYMEVGDQAVKLSVDSAIALNEFYSDRNGQEELVSVKRNEGGFVHKVDVLDEDETKRNSFKCDIIITGLTHKEADEERKIPESCTVKGAIFDFRKSLLPVEFTTYNPKAIEYFESQEPSNRNPFATQLWGNQVSMTTTREIRTESAFGDDDVRIVKSTRKDWVIKGSARVPYDWDDESSSMTVEELNKAIKNRELDLADLKHRSDEWKASRNSATPVKIAPSNGGFNF